MGKKQKASANEDAQHANMLAQLGLKADSKEGKEMLGVLKKKLTNEEDQEGWQEASQDENAEEIEYDDGKLTLGDLFTSIDKSKQT